MLDATPVPASATNSASIEMTIGALMRMRNGLFLSRRLRADDPYGAIGRDGVAAVREDPEPPARAGVHRPVVLHGRQAAGDVPAAGDRPLTGTAERALL